MNASKITVALVGASGYTGEELLRLLTRHPNVNLKAVTSRQRAGESLREAMGYSEAFPNIVFEDLKPADLLDRADVFFLALPHGVAAEYAVPLHKAGRVVLDLSADFRLRDPDVYKEFYGATHPAPELLQEAVYGLPELHGTEIAKAQMIACPGCYPTSILLALAPALKQNVIDLGQITVASMSGVSGAGKKADLAYSFCEVTGNMKPYGVPKHRHLSEIEQELGTLAGQEVKISFTPHLIPIHRGMLSTITAGCSNRFPGEDAMRKAYEDFYQQTPFVRILPAGTLPEVKRVAGTNNCEIAIVYDTRTNRLVLMSAIDNLGKGAGWQAIQCFNLKFGFDAKAGMEGM